MGVGTTCLGSKSTGTHESVEPCEHACPRPETALKVAQGAGSPAERSEAARLLRVVLAKSLLSDVDLKAKLLHSLAKLLLQEADADEEEDEDDEEEDNEVARVEAARNEAIGHLREASQLQPSNFAHLLSLSRALRLQIEALRGDGRQADAAPFSKERVSVLEAMSKLRPLHRCGYWLAMELRESGRHSEVPEVLQRYIDAVEEANIVVSDMKREDTKPLAMAKHWLSVYRGENTSTAPALYVEALFDSYAADFEESLRDLLDYKTPEFIIAELQQVLARIDDSQPAATAHERVLKKGRLPFRRCADLGCGTGLMAPLLRDLGVLRLEGVDLSEKMLELAQQKGPAGAGYDRLICGDLTSIFALQFESESGDEYDAMTCQPKIRSGRASSSQASSGFDGPERWLDLVVAADVFVYIGDLRPVLRCAASRLLPGGFLTFSTEAMLHAEILGEDASFKLEDSGRYSHNAAYVRSIAQAVGLELRSEQEVVLRTDGGKPVTGHVHVFEFPGEQ